MKTSSFVMRFVFKLNILWRFRITVSQEDLSLEKCTMRARYTITRRPFTSKGGVQSRNALSEGENIKMTGLSSEPSRPRFPSFCTNPVKCIVRADQTLPLMRSRLLFACQNVFSADFLFCFVPICADSRGPYLGDILRLVCRRWTNNTRNVCGNFPRCQKRLFFFNGFQKTITVFFFSAH